MSENEKKKKGSLDFSRRDFLRLAGTGVMAAAAAALPGGTAMAAEAKPAHGSRAKNKFKATGMQKGGKADLLILGNVITMDEYKPFAEAVAVKVGSLATGKLANLTVFDRDFLKDDFKDIEHAKCLATFVEGELVYHA